MQNSNSIDLSVKNIEELSVELEIDQENLIKALKALTEAGVEFKLKRVGLPLAQAPITWQYTYPPTLGPIVAPWPQVCPWTGAPVPDPFGGGTGEPFIFTPSWQPMTVCQCAPLTYGQGYFDQPVVYPPLGSALCREDLDEALGVADDHLVEDLVSEMDSEDSSTEFYSFTEDDLYEIMSTHDADALVSRLLKEKAKTDKSWKKILSSIKKQR